MSAFAQGLTTLCALGAATTAGVFFTFSNFTMTGLGRLSAAQGMTAMQAINAAAPSPLFMLLLLRMSQVMRARFSSDRLWVRTTLDPEEEERRIPAQAGFSSG